MSLGLLLRRDRPTRYWRWAARPWACGGRGVLIPAGLCGYLGTIHMLAFVAGPFVQGSPRGAVGFAYCPGASICCGLGDRFVADRSNRAAGAGGDSRPAFFLCDLNSIPRRLVFTFVVLPPLSDGHWVENTPLLAALAVMIVLSGLLWIGLGAGMAGGRMLRPYAQVHSPCRQRGCWPPSAAMIVATATL